MNMPESPILQGFVASSYLRATHAEDGVSKWQNQVVGFMWLVWRIRWRAATGLLGADSAAGGKGPNLRGDIAPIIFRNVA